VHDSFYLGFLQAGTGNAVSQHTQHMAAWHAVMQFSPWQAGNARAYDSRIYMPSSTVSDPYSQMTMFIFQ
jgi:hypothetical protein